MQELSKDDVMKLLIQYTYEVYIKKVANNEVSVWLPPQFDAVMNHYMDTIILQQPSLTDNINSLIIQKAIDETWTLAELVWTAIAIRTTTVPIIFIHCQNTIDNSTNDQYTWRMPISNNRTIHYVQHVIIPTHTTST